MSEKISSGTFKQTYVNVTSAGSYSLCCNKRPINGWVCLNVLNCAINSTSFPLLNNYGNAIITNQTYARRLPILTIEGCLGATPTVTRDISFMVSFEGQLK